MYFPDDFELLKVTLGQIKILVMKLWCLLARLVRYPDPDLTIISILVFKKIHLSRGRRDIGVPVNLVFTTVWLTGRSREGWRILLLYTFSSLLLWAIAACCLLASLLAGLDIFQGLVIVAHTHSWSTLPLPLPCPAWPGLLKPGGIFFFFFCVPQPS